MDRRAFLVGTGCVLIFPRPAIALASNYPRALANVLVSEGGNDDDPRDPGGRTSRGIIQREWNVWRTSHPGLPADVWRAPQREIEAIYRAKYWDVMRCDELPAGLDYTLFDYAVNSGVGRAPKVLQRILGVPVTGRMDDATMRAIKSRDAKVLIRAVNDERLRFLKSLSTWRYFDTGWSRRVASVRAISLVMAGGRQGSGALFRAQFGPGKAFDDDELRAIEAMP